MDCLSTEKQESLGNALLSYPLWERGLLWRTKNIMSNKDWLWVPGYLHGLVFFSCLLVLAHVVQGIHQYLNTALTIYRETTREGLRLCVHPHLSQLQWAEHSRSTFRCWHSWICCPPCLLIKPREWTYLWQTVMGLVLACCPPGITHEVVHARVL